MMTEVQNIQAGNDDETFPPPPDTETLTPFAELSRLMATGTATNDCNKLVWKAQTAPNAPWGPVWTPINSNSYNILGTVEPPRHDRRAAGQCRRRN